LYLWYLAYLKEKETGVIWNGYTGGARYSMDQKRKAVEHYLEYGRSFSRTARMLGYPSRQTLRQWCGKLAPCTRKTSKGGIKYTRKQKQEAVIELCTRTGSTKEIANKHSVTREALYK